MPLNRHEALQDLSRDHQMFLIEARTMRWIADEDPRAPALNSFLDNFSIFWEYHGEPHLIEEETVLFPFVYNDPHNLELVQLRIDHRFMRSRVQDLKDHPDKATPEKLRQLAEHITTHVRHEERVIFEQIQQQFDEDQLAELWHHSLEFRKDHRPADAIGPNAGRQD